MALWVKQKNQIFVIWIKRGLVHSFNKMHDGLPYEQKYQIHYTRMNEHYAIGIA